MSGIGSRFLAAGYGDPKPLIMVDGKPIIEHIINLFPKNAKYTFICNDLHIRETNMSSILKNLVPDCHIYQVPHNDRQGPVHAVAQIFTHIDDNDEIIVSYCDYCMSWDYNEFINHMHSNNAHGGIVTYTGFHPHMLGTDNYAFVKMKNPHSQLIDAIQEKKPFTNNRMNEHASTGTYYFKTGTILKKYFKDLIDTGIKINNEYYVSMVYNLLVKDGLNVCIYDVEYMLQWGTPKDLELYQYWSNYFRKPKLIQRSTDTTIILPMAGAGSRFSKKGFKLPKPLIPVEDTPMFIRALQCLPRSKSYRFIAQQEHHIAPLIKEYFPDTETKLYEINHVTDGQACTTGIALEELDPDLPIIITACDNGVYYDTQKYETLLASDPDVIVWTFTNHQTSTLNPNMYAWLETDENNNVLSVSCKQYNEAKHDIRTSHVIIGTIYFKHAYIFSDGFKYNVNNDIRTNNEFYVDDIISYCIGKKLNVKVFEVENYICWGTPDDYLTFCYWERFFNHVCNW